ncbi:MAG: hypothetical protein ACD_68C00021G0001 [uncultured bacterium]|nr:MAG: hypothetical protein ACD_68C00021G0001 [uncultured bacterium]
MSKRTRVNQQIRVPFVRVIDNEGKMLGEMPTSQALTLAHEQGLDLMEVSPNANPPVVKLLDFGRFNYHQMKQEQKHKRKLKKVEIKGVRISIRMSDHDFNFKRDQANKFFDEGHKVRVELIVRGRENEHLNLAYDILNKFIASLAGNVIVEQKPERQRLGLACVVTRKT